MSLLRNRLSTAAEGLAEGVAESSVRRLGTFMLRPYTKSLEETTWYPVSKNRKFRVLKGCL